MPRSVAVMRMGGQSLKAGKMRGGDPVEEGAPICRAGNTLQTHLTHEKSWNWDCQRVLTRHLCSKTRRPTSVLGLG